MHLKLARLQLSQKQGKERYWHRLYPLWQCKVSAGRYAPTKGLNQMSEVSSRIADLQTLPLDRQV